MAQDLSQSTKRKSSLALFLAIAGPGLAVMLAGADAGSLITAAQSGAVWGYKLLAIQIVLIPILYIAQELTVRLGLVTGKGHGELIKIHFGKFWAWFSVATLLVCCFGAIVSEFSGVAAVGLMFGIPSWASVLMVVIFLTVVVWTGSYNSVERVAILLGLCEFAFFAVAWMSHPSPHEMLTAVQQLPLHDPKYLYLMAANIGAVIMPWMIFYQQSAVVDKGLTASSLKYARIDTAIGAVITQLVMIAVLVAIAATIGKSNPGASLDSVHQISESLTPYLGKTAGQLLFAFGMLGASLIAAIVVSLTAAWGLGEITGYKRSLSHHPTEAPWFYGVYILMLVLGGALVASGINLIKLNIAIEVMNALLLPVALGFLYLLAVKTLPEQYRLKGPYAIVAGILLAITALFALFAGVWGSIFN